MLAVAPGSETVSIELGLGTVESVREAKRRALAKGTLIMDELRACGSSGDSTPTVQGGAIGNVQQLLYGWNETVLRQRGPCPGALVPGPVYRGMQQGRIVRFEEIARCSTEVQDGILSILSERQIRVPELEGADRVCCARRVQPQKSTAEAVSVVHAMDIHAYYPRRQHAR